jgi:prepilin-type N-terminal cleavage/methylation domain-containing protein
MQSDRVAQRGYSLTEILVVLAIIGIMSLVTVPQFVAYQQSAALKGAMRNFNADLRNCRQLAVARYVQVRMEFATSSSYRFYYRTTQGAAWQQMPQALLMALRVSGVAGNTKTLAKPMTFTTVDFVDQPDAANPANGLADIVFNTDGTLTFSSDPLAPKSSGFVIIGSPWKNVYQNRMKITVYTTGKIDTLGSKV